MMEQGSPDLEPLAAITQRLVERARHLVGVTERSASRFGSSWAKDVNYVLNAAFPTQAELVQATDGYIAFANESLRAQARFQSTGRYELSDFDSAAARVYHDREYMHGQYLPGLLLSHFLWPHHYAQLLFFRRLLRRLRPESFAEIGVGTGIYSATVILEHPQAVGTGIDISRSSLDFAVRLVKNVAPSGTYGVTEADIRHDDLSQLPDLVISVELLEHLEDPVDFLKGFANAMKPGAHGFIAAALNSAQADHIYLYTSPKEIEAQLNNAGLEILDFSHESAYLPRRGAEIVPSVSAYLVVRD